MPLFLYENCFEKKVDTVNVRFTDRCNESESQFIRCRNIHKSDIFWDKTDFIILLFVKIQTVANEKRMCLNVSYEKK